MHQRVVAASKVAAVALLAGVSIFWWLSAPLPENQTLQQWRTGGILWAAALGGIGAAWTGRWIRTGAAIALGLAAGATWAVFRFPNDIRPGLLESAFTVLAELGLDCLAPAMAAGLAGAFLVHVTSRARS